MCRLEKAYSEYVSPPFKQKKNYDRVMKALDSITSIREMTQVSISSYGLGQFGLAWIKSYLKNVWEGKKCLRVLAMQCFSIVWEYS